MSYPPPSAIRAVISDVDGTLVTDDKILTPRARDAARALQTRDYQFSLISARPPRALRGLIEQLALTTPLMAFNGGVFVRPDLSVISQHLLSAASARQVIDLIEARGGQVWVFAGDDWLARDGGGPLVAHEFRAVQFPPTVVASFESALTSVSMIVAISDDVPLIERCEADVRAALGAQASIARSHPNHLDVTPLQANKGAAIETMASAMGVALANLAVIGDGENDVAMFGRAAMSIAMGNASASVQAKADVVTASCNEDGFAKAIERYFLINPAAP